MLNRRQLLKGIGAVGGASMLGLPRNALGADDGKQNVLLWVFMNGGYAPIQTSAASFLTNPDLVRFGCTAANTVIMNEISYDKSTFGTLPQVALDRLACIGTEGASNHNSGKHFWLEDGVPTPQKLAAAMGGSAAIKAAQIGAVTGAETGTVDGVSLERVNDISSALKALTGAGQIILPEWRSGAGAVLQKTMERNQALAASNATNLKSVTNGYRNLIKSMTTPVEQFDANSIMTAYGMKDAAIGNDLSSKLAAAEILFRSGVKVVCVGEGDGTYWDTHDDNDGSRQRGYFTKMMPGLNTFCSRMLGTAGFNVTIAFISEHSRIPLISNHGPHLSTIVISDRAIGGKSTGITDKDGLVINPTKPKAMKAALGELCGLSGSANPFGSAGVHNRIIRSS